MIPPRLPAPPVTPRSPLSLPPPPPPQEEAKSLLEPASEADEEEGILISPKTVTTSFSTTPSIAGPSLLLLKTFMKFHVTTDSLIEVDCLL